MLNLSSVMLGSAAPKVLADFYEKVFGHKPDMAEEGDWYGWKVGNAFLSMGPHSEVKGKAREPQRVMINMETNEVKEEFERLKKLGVEVIQEPYEIRGAWIATLADPDGNYFQLMTPWGGK